MFKGKNGVYTENFTLPSQADVKFQAVESLTAKPQKPDFERQMSDKYCQDDVVSHSFAAS